MTGRSGRPLSGAPLLGRCGHVSSTPVTWSSTPVSVQTFSCRGPRPTHQGTPHGTSCSKILSSVKHSSFLVSEWRVFSPGGTPSTPTPSQSYRRPPRTVSNLRTRGRPVPHTYGRRGRERRLAHDPYFHPDWDKDGWDTDLGTLFPRPRYSWTPPSQHRRSQSTFLNRFVSSSFMVLFRVFPRSGGPLSGHLIPWVMKSGSGASILTPRHSCLLSFPVVTVRVLVSGIGPLKSPEDRPCVGREST